MIKTYIFAVFALATSLGLRAERTVFADVALAKTFGAIYAMNEAEYQASIVNVTDKPMRAYLQEYHALMQYVVANNQENFDRYIAASDEALDCVDEHEYEYTLRSNLQLHRCLVELSMGNLVSGGIQFWKSYNSFDDGETTHPNYEGQLKLRGVFNIVLAQIPDKWRSLAGFFGFSDGDLPLGLRQVADYHDKVKGVSGAYEESQLLSFANFFLSPDRYVTAEQEEELFRSKTPVVVYAYLLSCGSRQMGERADEVISRLSELEKQNFPLLYHQEAKCAVRRMDSKAALAAVADFQKYYKGRSNVNDGHLLKAYALLLDGRRNEALQAAEEAAKLEPTSDVDKRTQADAKIFAQMDINLLRARFNFEYGRFNESLRVLRETGELNATNELKIEYYFRLARAYDMLGQESEALANYEKTIELAAANKRYFGPHAALYAATMMINKGNLERATAYVAQAKKLNNGEYYKETSQRIMLAEGKIKKLSKNI